MLFIFWIGAVFRRLKASSHASSRRVCVSCLTYSNMARTGMRERQLPHSRLVGISQPSRQLALSKSPLASDFNRGNFLAFRPETEGSGRNAEPLGNCRSSHQRFAVMRHVLGLSSLFRPVVCRCQDTIAYHRNYEGVTVTLRPSCEVAK